MAWKEQIGMQSWRVRYRTGDGHIASISGFTAKLAADTCTARINNNGQTSRPCWPSPPTATTSRRAS